MEKTHKPTVAGILDMVAGARGIVLTVLVLLGLMFFITYRSIGTLYIPMLESRFVLVLIAFLAAPLMALSILAVVGGVFALKRKRWGLALAGSIGALLASPVLGIIAIIFTLLSKKEFEQSKPQ